MARSAVIGSPVVFFTVTGTQIEVPISTLYFENGVINTTRTFTFDTTKLLEYLAYRAQLGDLAPAPQPAPAEPAPALVATSAVTGSQSNSVQLVVAPGTAGTVTITAIETDTYPLLTLGNLSTALGVSGTAGTRPGLLRVRANPGGASPPPLATGTIAVTPASGSTTSSYTIAGSGTTAVVLEARVPATATAFDAGTTTVTMTPTSDGSAFALRVTWSQTVTVTTATTFATTLAPLCVVVTFAAPSSGFALPRLGTFTLSGGQDAVAASQSSTTLLANA